MSTLRELMMATDYVTLRMPLVDAVGFDAAVLLERIRWRCERRPEGWVATYDELATETRLSLRKVKAAVAALRERGWLLSENAGQGTRTLRWSVVLDTADPNDRFEPMPKGPDLADQRSETVVSTSTREDTLNTSPLPPAQLALVGAADCETAPVDLIAAEFDAFWRHWPDKRGRKTALQSYRRARKRATMGAIAAGFREHLPALQSRIDAGEQQFVPHASTWLNQDRWADPPPPIARSRDPYAGVLDHDAPSGYGDPYAGLGAQPATLTLGGLS